MNVSEAKRCRGEKAEEENSEAGRKKGKEGKGRERKGKKRGNRNEDSLFAERAHLVISTFWDYFIFLCFPRSTLSNGLRRMCATVDHERYRADR